MGRGVVGGTRTRRADPALLAGGRRLYGTAGAALVLLVWVTIKPLVRRRPPGCRKPSVKLNWAQTLRPRRSRGSASRSSTTPDDAEILNRALGLAQSQAEPVRADLAPRGRHGR